MSAPSAPAPTEASISSAILTFLSQSDTASVRAAEAALQAFLSARAAPSLLLSIACSSPHEPARQAAALFLRPRIISHWNRLRTPPPEGRAALQAALLQRLASEPSRPVRKALIGCVAALAKVLVPGGDWPELLHLLSAAAAAPLEEARELAQHLLQELADAVGANLSACVGALRPVVLAALQDGAPRVRLAALRATGTLLAALGDAEGAHRELGGVLPPLLVATSSALGMGGGGGSSGGAVGACIDEGAAIAAIEALEDLVECRSPLLTADPGTLETLFRGMLAVAEARHLEPGTRAAACGVVASILQERPQYVARRGLVAQPLLQAIFRIVETAWDPEEDEEAEAEAAAAGLPVYTALVADRMDGQACQLAETAAFALPAKALFPALSAGLSGALGAAAGGALPHMRTRLAALRILAKCASGLADCYQRALPSLLGLLLPSMSAAEAPVRQAACHALALVCDAAQPRIARAHRMLLPVISAALADPSPGVALRACWVLEVYGECLASDVAAQFAVAAVPALGALLSAPMSHGLSIHVLAALSSLAVSMGVLFAPYLPSVAPPLLALAAAREGDKLQLRASAMGALGYIVASVGSGAMGEGALGAALQCALEGFSIDSLEVRDSSFSFLACLARVAGESSAFVALLPTLVPVCLETGATEAEYSVAMKGEDVETEMMRKEA